MNRLIVWIIFVSSTLNAAGQRYLDSLHDALRRATSDTARILTLYSIAQYHEYVGKDSNAFYAQKVDDLSKKINYSLGRFLANRSFFYAANFRSDYPQALRLAFEGLQYAETMDRHRLYYMGIAQESIALVQNEMGDTGSARINFKRYDSLITASGFMDGDCWFYYSDKAGHFLPSAPEKFISMRKEGFEWAKASPHMKPHTGLAAAHLASAYIQTHHDSLARLYYQQGIRYSEYYNNAYFLARLNYNLAQFFERRNPDSSIYFGRRSIEYCKAYDFGDYASKVAKIVAGIFKSRQQPDSALKYMEVMNDARDSIFSQAKLEQFQRRVTSYEQKMKDDAQAKERYQANVRLYASIATLIVFLIISVILYRNNRRKQKANKLLSKQKATIETTLKELKTTQSQLIQSEKMASLGELTAGIAHEIQNPLNFVNNFSELNTELISEMQQEINNGHFEEVKNIAMDIAANEIKIIHHGQRAENIVKGMLEHSRVSSDQKESTDINAMAEEWFRLAYQGFRSKNKELPAGQAGFQVELVTDFDKNIGMHEILRQDIGRVLLNLFNNAFYAVAEKSRQSLNGYQPKVTITTKHIRSYEGKPGAVHIAISDNGGGIPKKIKDKIFQPFFTTKPTGLGTGLGLSLSYDIIKAQGGEIEVDSIEGEGAKFKISIPVG